MESKGADKMQMERVCPWCGDRSPPGPASCGICGHDLLEVEPSPVDPPSEGEGAPAEIGTEAGVGFGSSNQEQAYGQSVFLNGASGIYQTIVSIAGEVRSLPDFEDQKPDRLEARIAAVGAVTLTDDFAPIARLVGL